MPSSVAIPATGLSPLLTASFRKRISCRGSVQPPSCSISPPDRYSGPGSGEFNAGLGLVLDKWLGKWNLFSEAGYFFQGGSELYNPNGYLSFSTGIGYQLFETLNMALFGNGAVLPSDGSQDLMEGGFRISWMFLKKAGLECHVSRGFNEWSPEFGAGLALLSYF